MGYGLLATGNGLQVIGYGLLATEYGPRAVGYGLSAIGINELIRI